MAGMNPGFAKYLANKKAGTTKKVDFAPKGDVPKGKGDFSSKPSGILANAKRHSKVVTAPKLKHGKYL